MTSGDALLEFAAALTILAYSRRRSARRVVTLPSRTIVWSVRSIPLPEP